MSTTQPAPEYTMPANSEAWYQMAMRHNDKILRLERELMGETTEIEGLRHSVANFEAHLAAEVTAQTENGKPRFSNETARKAEISARLDASEGYQHLKELLRRGEFKRQIVQMELSEAQRMFSLAKYGLRAQGA